MTTEILYLTWTAVITVLMWIPATLQMMQAQGFMVPFTNRDNLQPLAPWAERVKRAHANSVENLVVFAVLVFAASRAGISNDVTVWACILYFWMRVIHYFSYAFGIIFLRSLVWTVGWVCLLALAWQILA